MHTAPQYKSSLLEAELKSTVMTPHFSTFFHGATVLDVKATVLCPNEEKEATHRERVPEEEMYKMYKMYAAYVAIQCAAAAEAGEWQKTRCVHWPGESCCCCWPLPPPSPARSWPVAQQSWNAGQRRQAGGQMAPGRTCRGNIAHPTYQLQPSNHHRGSKGL